MTIKLKRMPNPEWLQQRRSVTSGELSWDDFTFEQRTCKGWLLPYLFEIDRMFSSRWLIWCNALQTKRVPDTIPKIEWLDQPSSEVVKMFRDCLGAHCCIKHSVHLPLFFGWLLWGFGEGDERPHVAEEVNEYWYRTFNLGLVLKYPHDYLGELLADSKEGKAYWTNPHGFYPTPHSIVNPMVQMTLGTDDCRTKSVCDPCVGTGRMLMYASNYSFILYGQDIDKTCVMATKINGYFYVPWLVKPGSGLINGLERKDDVVLKYDRIRRIKCPRKIKLSMQS